MDATLNEHIKRFFDFSLSPGRINIVLPEQPRERESGFKRDNYPPFEFEVAPDDVKSAMKIHWLLECANNFEDPLEVRFCSDFSNQEEVEQRNRILIGGPMTNSLTCHAMRNFPVYFADAKGRRITEPLKKADNVGERRIITKYRKRPYTIGIKGDYLTRDYCLLSKRITGIHFKGTEFVIAGLRSYGQLGSCYFLGNETFYNSVECLCEYDEFQVVVEVTPEKERGRIPPDNRVVSLAYQQRPNVFIGYVREDQSEVKRLVRLFQRGKLQVKWDQNIESATGWEKWIEDNINQCDCYIVCLSDAFIHQSANYVLEKEIPLVRKKQESKDRKLSLIPILLTNCDPQKLSKQIPEKLSEQIPELEILQATKLPSHDDYSKLAPVIKRIRKDFGKDGKWVFREV